MLKEKIRQLAKQYAPEFISIRHHLHAHPELSYQEFKTSAFVQQKLSDAGIPFRVMAETGVVGMIEGRNPGKRVIALRAGIPESVPAMTVQARKNSPDRCPP